MAGRGFEKLWQCVLATCLMVMHNHVTCCFKHSPHRQLSLNPFQTTGVRDSIDGPALNQIWSEMTTEERMQY